MGFLDRKKLLTREKLEIVRVDVGDGDWVYVRQMTGRERDQFERSLFDVTDDNQPQRRLENFRSKLAVSTICDEQGVLLFTMKDVDALSDSISARRLEMIVSKAQQLNKITEEDKEKLVKNSEGGPAASFSSDSVEN